MTSYLWSLLVQKLSNSNHLWLIYNINKYHTTSINIQRFYQNCNKNSLLASWQILKKFGCSQLIYKEKRRRILNHKTKFTQVNIKKTSQHTFLRNSHFSTYWKSHITSSTIDSMKLTIYKVYYLLPRKFSPKLVGFFFSLSCMIFDCLSCSSWNKI